MVNTSVDTIQGHIAIVDHHSTFGLLWKFWQIGIGAWELFSKQDINIRWDLPNNHKTRCSAQIREACFYPCSSWWFNLTTWSKSPRKRTKSEFRGHKNVLSCILLLFTELQRIAWNIQLIPQFYCDYGRTFLVCVNNNSLLNLFIRSTEFRLCSQILD